ncbi:MAG: MutS-related protein, partial [Candidatus Poseidoniaceae archaeon]
VGAGLARKLTDHFGTEDKVLQLLADGQTEVIAEVEGVSQKRADSLARSFNGMEEFLATPESIRLHKELVASIANHAVNASTRSRLRSLMPVKDIESRREIIAQAMECDFLIEGLRIPSEVNGNYDRVVVSKNPIDELKRFCRVLTPSEQESWKDYKVFKSVTWVGPEGPAQTPDGWLVLPESASVDMILPEKCVGWFEHNRESLELLTNLPEGQGFYSHFNQIRMPQLRELLDEMANEADAEAIADVRDKLWPMAKELEKRIHDEVDEAMQNVKLDLSGSDMLEALADAASLQRKLAQQTSDAIEQAIESATDELANLLSEVGVRCPRTIFKAEWPTKVDRTTLDGIDSQLEELWKTTQSDRLISLARRLAPLKSKCEYSLRKLVELDQWLTIGRWAKSVNAVMPEITKHGIAIKEGRHLLIDGVPDPVDYGLGNCADAQDRQSIALLTGANSGGKTTMLELLAHCTILAHMGLPVPAKSAKVGRIESLHVLAKAGGTQSAGALEQTLLQLAEVVSNDNSKLILADELEAITEPGAGARIIAGMLEAAESHSGTCMLLVTHLAPSIIEASGKEMRTDGIEARGLDENLELIVDRTPRRNHLARSTPELIVRRLVERSQGDAKSVFNSILGRF